MTRDFIEVYGGGRGLNLSSQNQKRGIE